MDHSVENITAFTVHGIGVDCPSFDTSGIGDTWTRFNMRSAELPPGGRVVGVGLPRPTGFYYIAGMEVPEGTAVPAGMESTVVPGAPYFHVPFHDHPSQMGPTFSLMFSQLIPAAGLKHEPGPVCWEEYPPNWHDEENAKFRCELYVQLAGDAA
jgi:predicted transcriptional regulator YdeE